MHHVGVILRQIARESGFMIFLKKDTKNLSGLKKNFTFAIAFREMCLYR